MQIQLAQRAPGKQPEGQPPKSLHAWLLTVPEKRLTPEHRELLRPREAPAARFLWDVYVALSGRRRSGMSGADPIGFDQVLDWQTLTGRRLRGWQVSALFKVDAEWKRIVTEASNERG